MFILIILQISRLEQLYLVELYGVVSVSHAAPRPVCTPVRQREEQRHQHQVRHCEKNAPLRCKLSWQMRTQQEYISESNYDYNFIKSYESCSISLQPLTSDLARMSSQPSA